MSKFGEELRRERETRGIALESITNTTKISNRNLLALEAEEFDHLPGGVLNKGIVRGYAQAVGLDQEDWVNRFMSAYRDSGKVKDDDVYWIAFAQNVGKNRHHGIHRSGAGRKWAGVAVLVVLLAALGWFVWRYVSDRNTAQVASHQAVVAAAIMQSSRN